MKIKFLIAFILLFIIKCEENTTYNDEFLNWGKKNKLKISHYIEVASIEKDKIRFIAKTNIPKKKKLLTIPNSLMFNITKALKLINSKNLNKQYEQFSKLNLTYEPNPYDFRKEESFLSYIFYLIDHKSKKYKKTKFYENYQQYFESLKHNKIKSALFFDQDQLNFLAGTHLGHSIEVLRKVYQDETDILNKETYYKKYLDYDDYIIKRLIINNKGLNISNHWTLVPFLNYFDDDYTDYNANYTIEENGDMNIMSKKKIQKGEEIVLKAKKMSNIRRFLLQGKTNEKLLYYFEDYIISAIAPGLYKHFGIKDYDYFQNYYINVLEKDFDSKATGIYLDHAEMLNGDGSDTWAYSVLQKNLLYYKERFNRVTLGNIYDVFYDKDDRINIDRIFRGEKKVLEKAYNEVMGTINHFVDIQNKYMSDDNKNKENIIDL